MRGDGEVRYGTTPMDEVRLVIANTPLFAGDDIYYYSFKTCQLMPLCVLLWQENIVPIMSSSPYVWESFKWKYL